MNIPNGLLYTKTHEWVESIGGGKARVGLTDHAQEALGDIVFVSLPGQGDELNVGDVFAGVESVKAVSDVFSPVSGAVIAVNDPIADDPARINADCYGAWLVEIQESGEREELLDADAYRAFVSEEG
ncbi:MAG: glycine cleavage system protein GcvH [Oscillospiraceae bacterium]|jgi:glycine cleavage system H protein|nr:glycine cleavage system protein GcvH [Oscillospiraceae bacterium]